MSFPELLSWAWRETPPVHRNATNLMIDIVAVPLFVLGHFFVVTGLIANPWWLAGGALCILVSLAAQKYGHSLEHNQVHALTGAGDFVRRLYAEQFCNFWRFLFSGQWYESLKANRFGA